MTNHQQDVLDALKLELRFLDYGGYGRSVRDPRKELTVFRDSPSCLNCGSPVRFYPCSECFLMDFVPADKRSESVPCHHIVLNDRGETLANLEGRSQVDVEENMRQWLTKTIAEIEKAA